MKSFPYGARHLSDLQKIERLQNEVTRLASDVAYKDPRISSYKLGNIIGNSSKAREIVDFINTVSVPIFENDTYRRGLEYQLTEAVQKEIQTRTPYRLARGTDAEIRTGVEITLRDIATTLNNRGVKIEDPTGEKFDPLRHQALSYEPVPGVPDGTIATCYRKGYIMGDRLIRPALVKVAQAAAEEEASVNEPVSH